MNDIPPRNKISIGMMVEIVQKHDQRSGQLTSGTVKRILTSSHIHPHGIKVELDSKVLTKQQKELAYNAEQEALCFPTQIDQEKLLREGYKCKHIFLDENDIVFQTIFTNKNSCGFD